MTIRQYPVQWGPTTSPWSGTSYFYSSTAVDLSSQISPLFDAIKQYFPPAMIWTFPGWYRELDETNGKLTDIVVGASQGTIQAPASSLAVAPSQGLQIRWNTNGFPHGRRVVGRTYLVPMLVNTYGTDGLGIASTCNTINAAADALRSRSGNELSIWNRPITKKDPNDPTNDILVRPGSRWPVISTVCPRKPVQLSSRRDV
jgi:hypothetical protein